MFTLAKRFHFATGILCLAALALYATANPDKVAGVFRIAVVDVEAAVNGYDRYQEELEAIKKEFQPRVDALTAEEDALLKRQEALDNDESLDPAAQRVARAELQADYQKLQGRGSLLNQQVQKARLTLRKEIVDDLNLEIAKIANEDGLHMVLRIDTDAVLYAQDSLDITPKLIDRLNEAYKRQQ
jgi:Skp family chaperone for outer membrane proteins